MALGFLSGNALRLDGLIERLESAEGLEDLQILIEELRDSYGVDHIVYHWVNSNGEQYGCGTYDLEWVNRYVEKGYLRVDPVVVGCYQRFHPVDWKRLDWSSKAARALMQDAIAYGIGNQGFSIPLRGPNGQFALFTLSHNCNDTEWEDFTLTNRRDLILIAHYFNQKALEFEPGRTPEASQSLSPREIEAMTLLAVGYSRAQAADTLSISEHTLRVYVESARHKLGALNTTHAVARALSRGVIVV
ncbi:HTH-type quorum sensing-dependent transcriptional regulator VjbR [Antarctobacter heliothermus]|uniref:HTH-type quorum sensing-dependent transcriptional regulator VjbR n=1 Tax=Antarctobacter heliothermus TaxID=74033 RepID=A0A222E3N5_9RHOB|nr:LuxR family transcriptional regulator [Antarctobacter heliothermus]ASP20824.1 HTH-type quorum sensing-dependent transcriptional regulator VjbR [Antarctobacter heliothermus]MBT56069.1 LuxR family transcriptional regulator [Mameliella sp.]|tara:strand:+ start:3173 stop:3910 length:738 start_codon:yes stop_codon:yes gene_type:complete